MFFVLGLALSSIFYWTIFTPRRRRDFLLIVSVLVLYALQPQTDVNSLNIVLPTATLIMVVGVWLLIFPPTEAVQPGRVLKAAGILAVLICFVLVAPQASALIELVGGTISHGVQLQVDPILTVVVLAAVGLTAMPQQKRNRVQYVLAGLCLFALILLERQTREGLASLPELIGALTPTFPRGEVAVSTIALIALSVVPIFIPLAAPTLRKRLALIWLVLMGVLLVVLKVDALTAAVGAQLNADNGVSTITTAALGWLGISYIVFRLAHVLLDFRADRLTIQPGLRDFLTYVIFFPSIIAGPITRVEQVTVQFQENLQTLKADNVAVGSLRLIVGLTKKYLIADQLGLIAASPALFTRTSSTFSLWIMLYAFLFQFYLDFSGYSDIAIGLGLIFGVRLPENFDRPLLQPNPQLFWNSWHITLSMWFRYYWFNPLTRRLMRTRLRLHPLVIVFLAQTSTMILISMWHHMSFNWLAWGLWQALGLFTFKVLGDANRQRFQRWTAKPWRAHLLHAVNVILTFHYFLFSMAFIAFPDIQDGVRYLFALFGVRL